MEVLDRLRNINRTSRAKSFDSFDFSILYTNIPHEALKTNIRNLIREAFKVRGSKYLTVSRDGKAHWSLEPSLWSACVSVDNSKLVEWTNYLIDNVYIKVGSKATDCWHSYGNRLCTPAGKPVPFSLRVLVYEILTF